jgi:hypothetical protein
VWFEPVSPPRLSQWGLADNVFFSPWRLAISAIATLSQRIARPSGRVQVSAVSEEWLREQGTESAKHAGDP